ncbi:sugar transferase [Deinococcus sp. YIM 134068]|uniref:sugar transferase n=1 Tax=Deinococcus lichenicola TaxID=3118910 RepID=UPI002F944ABB
MRAVTGTPVIRETGNVSRRAAAYEPLKLALDRLLAVLGLVVLWPVFALVALAIFVDDPGPVLFQQRRAGRWHRPFTILKFRTMRRGTPHLSTEDLRCLGLSPYTRLGPWLRRTSLDELPQLLNVLRGEMSLVGPRPALLTQELVLLGREALGVSQLRPGITGLAQVTGRDDLTDEEKVRRDHTYLRNIGPLTDVLVLAYTVRGVLRGRGVY